MFDGLVTGGSRRSRRRAVGVDPEYVVRLYPFAATLPPDAFHLPVGRPVTHKVYRDAVHPSRLVLPFTVAD